MPLPNQKKKYTIEDIYALPDGVRAELIDGHGSRRMGYSIKLFKNHSSGVREYWIVDPDKNRITVHDLEHEDVNEYTFTDSVIAGIYEDLSIDFGQLNI